MNLHLPILFLASTVATAAAFTPKKDDAASNRYHAAHCVMPGNDGDGIKRSDNYGAGNIYAYLETMVCPVDDIGTFSKADAINFVVEVRDHTSSFYIKAATCVDFRGGTGGACGFSDQTGTSFVGFDTLIRTTLQTDSIKPWVTYFADFGYIEVDLPGGTPSNYSSVRGYKVGY